MKRFVLILFFLAPFFLSAQEAEQSIPADSYTREGSTMIISYTVPKSDVPIDLHYNVKDIFFTVDGQTNRAITYSGETSNVAPGRHTIYWEIGQDAPSLYNVQEIFVLTAFTPETFSRVEDWKRNQQQKEHERILEEVREQERQRIRDSLNRANANRPSNDDDDNDDDLKTWGRKYARTQFGVTGSLGTGTYFSTALPTGIAAHEPAYFPKDQDDKIQWSWQAGGVLRTHFAKWLGIQVGVLYSNQLIASTITPSDGGTDYLLQTETKGIQVPATLHLYLGSKLNLLAGYSYHIVNSVSLLDESEDTEAQEVEKDAYQSELGALLFGAELRGEHTALTFTYQKDSQEFWKDDIDFMHGAYWLSFTLFF